MGSEGYKRYHKESTTDTYPEPDESTPHHVGVTVFS
jgi:hypothetical protein